MTRTEELKLENFLIKTRLIPAFVVMGLAGTFAFVGVGFHSPFKYVVLWSLVAMASAITASVRA